MKYTELILDAVDTIQITTKNLVSTNTGFITSILPVLALAFTSNNVAILCLIIVMILDMIWGIWVAVRHHEFSISGLGKKTLAKMLIYGSVISVIFLLERASNPDWYLTSRIVIIVAAATETFSLLANMSIIYPNFIFLKLIRKALVAEIASKLGLKKCEVEGFFQEQQLIKSKKKCQKQKKHLK